MNSKNRYIGSVRFFKHLILFTVFAAIAVPTIFSVVFAVKNLHNKEEIRKYQSILNTMPLNISNETDSSHADEVLNAASCEYQSDYEDLYVERHDFVDEQSEKPIVYLTFDDGPSQNTIKVLDILKENDIKATFFVVLNTSEEAKSIYRRIVEEGHTIGVHTASHNYKQIYASVDSYLEDFNTMFNYVYEVTGVKPQIFRFPGGSINAYNQEIYQRIAAEMLRRGFTYYDWNVSSGDSKAGMQEGVIRNAVISGVEHFDKSIVLMHDSSTRATTAAALPAIIENLKEKYEFRSLDNSVRPIVFTYTVN